MIPQLGADFRTSSGHEIQTVSGRMVDVFDLDPELLDLGDIATGLAMFPRFAGQIYWHFSVAQHAANCCTFLAARGYDSRTCLAALHHDDDEGLLFDIPRPIKVHPMFAPIRQLALELQTACLRRWVGIEELPEAVHWVDNVMCYAEAHLLKPTSSHYDSWPERLQLSVPELDQIAWDYVIPKHPRDARQHWLYLHEHFSKTA